MLTYTTYVVSLGNLMPVNDTTNVNFTTLLPNVIDYAELRIQQDLDLLSTITTDSSANFTAGTRDFTLPSTNGTFVVPERLNVITPAGATTGSPTAVRNPVVPTSKEMLDFLWPSVNGSAVPTYFARPTQTMLVLGPWPDQAYNVEVSGTIRMLALSTTNVTTFISVNLPHLFLAASMVFASGYMKNFGAQADDPKMSQSWEAQYQALLKSSATEEARKKFTESGWSSKQPAPEATPPRT